MSEPEKQEIEIEQDADSQETNAQQPPAPEPAAGETGQISVLQAELAAVKEQALRALADAENTRKRAQKEREDAASYSIASFARDMLDVADNLRRALDATPLDLLESEPRLKNVIEGIQATERSLLSIFERNGIQKLEPLEQMFDPNFHEVMFETPGVNKPAGTVMVVVEPGYTLKDRLLRPARVGVAKDEGQNGTGAGNASPLHPGGTIDTKA